MRLLPAAPHLEFVGLGRWKALRVCDDTLCCLEIVTRPTFDSTWLLHNLMTDPHPHHVARVVDYCTGSYGIASVYDCRLPTSMESFLDGLGQELRSSLLVQMLQGEPLLYAAPPSGQLSNGAGAHLLCR